MTDVRLQAELAESKAVIQTTRTYVHGNTNGPQGSIPYLLSPKMVGLRINCSARRILCNIEVSAQIGRWEQADKLRIAVLKITDSAKMFYNGCLELHGENATWED